MSSTNLCSNCSAPLIEVTSNGLCETCFVRSTNRDRPSPEGVTQSYLLNPNIIETLTQQGRAVVQPADHTKYQSSPVDNAKNSTELFEDRYQILHALGTGGMGEVWKAFDRNTERFVAIKYIKSAQFQSMEYNRFLTEARAMANLNHGNVLRLFDFSVDPQRPYMVLEYVDGQSLSAKLSSFKKAPMPYLEVARVMEAAARGVQSAHECNVLHRDLKPSNIMLSKDGVVKVLDFGLAKRTSDASSHLTMANTMVGGTPGFTAPEQVQNGGISTPQTDVWGLGATLYALLAGSAPYPTGVENIGKVLTEPLTPLRNKRIGVPAALEAIARKCLTKDPTQRYATAQDVADELGRFQRHEPVHAKPISLAERVVFVASRVPSSTWLVMLVLLVVVASGATLATLPKRTIQESEQDQLRAGQPVTIIGEEHPEQRTFRSFIELNSLGKSVVPKSGSALMSNTITLCELSVDPGSASYTIEGEVQYRLDLTRDQPKEASKVGLYFDHQVIPLLNSCTLMSFFSVTFRDYDVDSRVQEVTPKPSQVVLRHHAYHLDANGSLSPNSNQIYVKQFPTSLALPSSYKKIVVEVQPDCFRFWWNNETTSTPDFVYPRTKIERKYAEKMKLPEFFDQLQSPNEPLIWSPRHGVGLYCELAQMGVKNFKITPVKP